jgi:adenylate cyclase
MVLNRSLRIKLASWFVVVVLATAVGGLYSEFAYPVDGPNPGDWKVGMVTGALIALLSIPLEIFSRDFAPMVTIRGLPHGLNWLTRSVTHLSIILFALLGTQYFFDVFYYHRVLFSTISVAETTQDAIFASIVLLVVVFILEMRALVGGRVMAWAFLGGYEAPRVTQRIFVILDMVQSSEAAAVLGDRGFHSYLSDAFRLVEQAVGEEEGEIYTFIGDALIASWPLEGEAANARPLRALQRVFADLEADRATFLRRYGQMPQLRAVLHGGDVLIGQYGEQRRQVTYLGEVLNIASRMERFAKQTGAEVLISQTLLERIALPDGYLAAPVSAAQLDHWQGNVELMVLHRPRSTTQSIETIDRSSALPFMRPSKAS